MGGLTDACSNLSTAGGVFVVVLISLLAVDLLVLPVVVVLGIVVVVVVISSRSMVGTQDSLSIEFGVSSVWSVAWVGELAEKFVAPTPQCIREWSE